MDLRTRTLLACKALMCSEQLLCNTYTVEGNYLRVGVVSVAIKDHVGVYFSPSLFPEGYNSVENLLTRGDSISLAQCKRALASWT